MSAPRPTFTPDPERRGPDDGALRAAFLAGNPPEAFFTAVDEARALRPWRRLGLRPLALGFAAAGLALALVVAVRPDDVDGARDKGTALPTDVATSAEVPTLGFVIKRDDALVPGVPGLVCHAGDRLRLVATQQQWTHGLAFSVDANGRVEVLHAGPDGRSLPLVRGRDVPLPGSRELDAYTGPEWYWLVVSDRPLPLAEVAEKARRAVLDHVAKGGRPAELTLAAEEGARALGFWIDKR